MERKRLQIDLAPEAVQELQELLEKTGLTSRADLIRYALRFLQWTVDELEGKDTELLVQKNGEIRKIVLPFLRRSRPEPKVEMETVGTR